MSEVGAVEITWSPRLGAHLAAFRQRAGLRRVDLATQIGVSEETVRLWEKAAVRPSRELLPRLIALLSLEVTDVSVQDADVAALPPLAHRVRDERADRAITQAEAARLIGVAQTTFAAWETGRTSPTEPHHDAVASFLGITAAEVAAMREVTFTIDSSGWCPLGKIIGPLRELRQIERAELADRVGVAASTIAAWELGYRVPSAEHMRTLAVALDVEVAVLAASLPRRDTPTPLGALIVSRRQELGIRSVDVARRSGTTETVVSRWINGRHRPAAASLRRLAQALELPFAAVAQAAARGVEVLGSPVHRVG